MTDFEVVIEPGIEGLPERVALNIKSSLTISEDLNREVDEAAATAAYWAVMAGRADAKLARLQFAFDMWRAEIEKELFQEREVAGLKPFTQGQLETHIKTHIEFRKLMVKILKLKQDVGDLKSLARAFEYKKDMIQTKSANLRREMEQLKGG